MRHGQSLSNIRVNCGSKDAAKVGEIKAWIPTRRKTKALMLFIIMVMTMGFLSTDISAQTLPRYGCQFWKNILTGIDSYKIVYNRRFDSIINRQSNRLWFDDPMLHFQKVNYIVDTFGFFGPDCNMEYKGQRFIFTNSLDTAAAGQYVIYLRSIKVYRDKFMLAFDHPESEWDIYFDFKIYAGHPPFLYLIARELRNFE